MSDFLHLSDLLTDLNTDVCSILDLVFFHLKFLEYFHFSCVLEKLPFLIVHLLIWNKNICSILFLNFSPSLQRIVCAENGVHIDIKHIGTIPGVILRRLFLDVDIQTKIFRP